MKALFATVLALALVLLWFGWVRIHSGNGAGWIVSERTDTFDGEFTTRAQSPLAIGEPYGTSAVVVRCSNGKDLDVFLAYRYLNRPGADDAAIQVKFDDEAPRQQSVGLSTNGRGLFLKSSWFAYKLAQSTSFATRFDYYGEGAVTIAYDLTGATDAIVEVLAACGSPAVAQ